MKRVFNYRFARFMFCTVCVALVTGGYGCVAGSSRNTKIGTVPGHPHEPKTPVLGETSPLERVKESYRIYSAILNHKWDKGNIVVRNHTGRGLFQNEDWLANNVGRSYPDAVTDFNKANEKEMQIERRFDYTGKISTIDEAEFKKTIGGVDGWELFRKSHPEASGIVTFSVVGFDRDGSHALVNSSYLCAAHCGNGTLYVLEKREGEWAIAEEIGTWMS